MKLGDTAYAQVRYSFTAQFLEAAASFIRKAAAIEDGFLGAMSDEQKAEHRGYVSTAIMQCAAALETEAHEICCYGPGSHLGSNGTDLEAQKFLSPLQDFIDSQETLQRYRTMLHLLRKPDILTGSEPYQSAALVVRLRNEITHYKSRWGEEMSRSMLLSSLEGLKHKAPPFSDPLQNFFPHRCLSADCGAWALQSTTAFLDKIYKLLEVPSRLEPYRERLKVKR